MLSTSMFGDADAVKETTQAAPSNVAAADEEPDLFQTDDFRMYCMKVLPCSKRSCHDWQQCPYAHPGEKAKRRNPRLHSYTGIACPNMKQARKCPRGDACPYAHNVFEYWLHPTRYCTQLCKDGRACNRRICFFAHSAERLRSSAEKPHVPAEALAAATAAAALEAARAAPAGNSDKAEMSLLNQLLKPQGSTDSEALRHLHMLAAGEHMAPDQQQQLVDALATLLLTTGMVQQEMPEAQSQPLPALDNRMELAALGKVHSEPLYSHARRNRARRHRSSDLPSSVPATVSEGVETPDTFNFLAPELQQAQPARFTVREEAAYAAGVAAAIAAQQEQQHQRDAASFMQSLQQAAREQASAKEAAAVSAFPASNVLGEGGSGYGALSFAGASLPTSAFAAQPGFGAADLGAWNFGGHAEPEGTDFTGASAFGLAAMGRRSGESSRLSSDTFTGMEGLQHFQSMDAHYRRSEDSMRSSMDLGPATSGPNPFASNHGSAFGIAAASAPAAMVNYRLSSFFASSAPYDVSATQGF